MCIEWNLESVTITGGSCHKYHFCHHKSSVCRNKRVFVKTNMSFVITKVCLTLCVWGGGGSVLGS